MSHHHSKFENPRRPQESVTTVKNEIILCLASMKRNLAKRKGLWHFSVLAIEIEHMQMI